MKFVPDIGTYKLSGGGLIGNYTLIQFHLHWGLFNSRGSEHHIDDMQYSAEVTHN